MFMFWILKLISTLVFVFFCLQIPAQIWIAIILCVFGQYLGIFYFIKFRETPYAECMGNSHANHYSPGFSQDDSFADANKVLKDKANTYPETFKTDIDEVMNSAQTIVKQEAKGAFIETNASLFAKNPTACAVTAGFGASWYAKDAAVEKANKLFNRGYPIEVIRERRWETKEETKIDE